MLTNMQQVRDYFSDPDNIHKLYVYEIVDFDNNIESIVSANTNNFLKIKYYTTIEGIFESCTFTPQIKVMSQNESDVGLKINTDYGFITNDNMSFLEKTNKTYVFTVNEEFIKDETVYFLGDGSTKAINELNDDDKLDDNLINLFYISLQSIKKMEIGKNCTINFKLIESLPNIKKINSISYEIPLESVYQTIQVIGDIKNDLLGIEIKDEKLDLELVSDNGIVPVIANLSNLNQKAELEIFNFSVKNQIPLILLKEFITNDNADISKIFQLFKDNNEEIGRSNDSINNIISLLKKVILISYVYNMNFSMFDKNNEAFIKHYNATYANKTALEFNTQLIFDFQMKNPNIVDNIEFKVFEAICFNLSHCVLTPFNYQERLTNEHKSKVWYWLDILIPSGDVKSMGFNYNGSILSDNELPNIFCSINSDYFNFIKNNQSDDTFTVRNKIKNLSYLNNEEYLPKNNISQLDSESLKYLTYIFTENDTMSEKIITEYAISNKQEEVLKTIILKNNDRYPTIDELKQMLPADAENIEVIGEVENSMVDGEKIYLECEPYITFMGGYPYKNGNLISCSADTCTYEYYRWENSSSGYGGSWTRSGSTTRPRPFKQTKLYQSKATFRYSTYFNVILDKFSFSTSKVLNFLLDKNNFKNKNIIKFNLNKLMVDQGWYISKIKEDYHYSFLNSASKTILNYIDENDEIEKTFEYNISNSFQKIDNTNVLTKNRY